MNEQLGKYVEGLQLEIENERLNKLKAQNEYGKLSSFINDKEQNIVQYQLDLKEELDRVQHLLSGHYIAIDTKGNEVWKEPEDDRLKIFSENGVKQLMNILSFYVNRNVILSHFTEEDVNTTMYHFSIEISDLIYNKYESFFSYPTPEELYAKVKRLIDEGTIPYDIDNYELYNLCMDWSSQELELKATHLPMICISLIDIVYATYRRALYGETIKSLRTMTTVSQNLNAPVQLPNHRSSFSLFKPGTWGKKNT